MRRLIPLVAMPAKAGIQYPSDMHGRKAETHGKADVYWIIRLRG
jgi:hypothetical protein